MLVAVVAGQLAAGGRSCGSSRCLVPISLQQFATGTIGMESNDMMTQVSFLAKPAAASLANARLESGVNPLVPMDTKDPIECLVAVAALELARCNFLNFAHRHGAHLCHLGNQRVVVIDVLYCAYRL